jgi:ATP-dependent RNA helicase DDX51/DBP6
MHEYLVMLNNWQLQLPLILGVGKDEVVRGDFIGKFTTPAELSEYICVVTPESKPLVLYHIIASNSWQHVLVFVGSRKDAHRLSLLLSYLGQKSFKVAEISSSLLRPAREKVLAKFATGKIDV